MGLLLGQHAGEELVAVAPVLLVTTFNLTEKEKGVLHVMYLIVLVSGKAGCVSRGQFLSHTP